MAAKEELALTGRFQFVDHHESAPGAASVQLAFRVPYDDVDVCAAELAAAGVLLLSPPTDRTIGHRTLFFQDPYGNLLEIYAEF